MNSTVNMEKGQKVRKRFANWTDMETNMLKQLFVKHSSILNTSFSKAKRKGIWEDITKQVNLVNHELGATGHQRTVERKTKKKWKNVKNESVAAVRKLNTNSKGRGKCI